MPDLVDEVVRNQRHDAAAEAAARHADAAGVSVATVSNVLNGKASVAADISGRVNAAIDALGYVRDHRAARLRSQHRADLVFQSTPEP